MIVWIYIWVDCTWMLDDCLDVYLDTMYLDHTSDIPDRIWDTVYLESYLD